MSNLPTISTPISAIADRFEDLTTVEIAQVLAQRLTISSPEWHKLKSNRKARSQEQAIAAIIFLLQNQPEEALPRLQQATGWIDRSISAPPCPDHR